MATSSYAFVQINGPDGLSTTISGAITSPATVAFPDGSGIVFVDTTSGIRGARLGPTGEPTGQVVTVSAVTTADDPAATVLRNGNVLAVWDDPNGVAGRVFTSNLVPVTGELRLMTASAFGLRYQKPDVTALADGGFAVVAQNDDNDNNTIEVATFSASGSFQAIARVGNGSDPSVATLANGNLAFGWQRVDTTQTTSTNIDVWTAVKTPSLAVVQGEQLFDSSGQYHRSVDVAPRPDGTFTVTWDTGSAAVTASFAASGAALSAFPSLSVQSASILRASVATSVEGYQLVTAETGGVSGNQATLLAPDGHVLALGASLGNLLGEIAQPNVTWADPATIELAYYASNSYTVSRFSVVHTTTGDGTAEALTGDGLVDVIIGLGGADSLYGYSGNDLLYGGIGDDNLWGGLGADGMDGGADFDYARYDFATGAVTARLDMPSFNAGEAAGDYYASIEGLVGSTFDDTLVGDENGNTLIGLAGGDSLLGLDGNDALIGGEGDDNLWGGLGTDYIDGGAGFDFARFDYATAGVTARLDGGANTGEAAGDFYLNVEGLIGSTFGDVLVGDNAGNTLISLAGNDQIYGLAGNDALIGGDGDDQIYGGTGTDFIDGGAGFDFSRYDFAAEAVAVRLDTGVGYGGEANGDYLTSVEGLVGSSFGDALAGNAAANSIFGQGGNDVIYGFEGADSLNGGGGNDTFGFRLGDFQAGVYDRITDFHEAAGDTDLIALLGVPAASLRYYDTPNGALITTADLNGSGGIIVDGVSLASIGDQIYLV